MFVGLFAVPFMFNEIIKNLPVSALTGERFASHPSLSLHHFSFKTKKQFKIQENMNLARGQWLALMTSRREHQSFWPRSLRSRKSFVNNVFLALGKLLMVFNLKRFIFFKNFVKSQLEEVLLQVDAPNRQQKVPLLMVLPVNFVYSDGHN